MKPVSGGGLHGGCIVFCVSDENVSQIFMIFI